MSVQARSTINRVWLDVTSLLQCSGQPHGITRTVLNLFREWHSLGYRNLNFCCLQTAGKEQQHGYVEVAPETIAKRFQVVEAGDTQIAADADRLGHSLKQTVKKIIRPVTRLIPTSIKHRLRRGIHLVKKTAGRLRIQPHRKAVEKANIEFCHSDLIILAGLTWDNPESILLHWKLKQQNGLKQAYFIHDLIPVFFPHFFGGDVASRFEHWVVDALWSADFLWANSEHTRRDLDGYLQRCRIGANPTNNVVRLGDILPEKNRAAAPRGFPLEPGERFVLCVGTIEFRKNHMLLYHVWRRLANDLRAEKTPKLVVVGRRGHLSTEFCAVSHEDPLTTDRIFFHHAATDEELRWFYENCLFTMYPSHYEGWGLPVAESLAHGKYCIASKSSSIPEIGGSLVGYHDPLDALHCLELVIEALDPMYLSQRETRIRQEYRRTTWGVTARQMIDQLQSHFGSILIKEAADDRIERSAA